MTEKQARVILWCVPRSVSTAFEVCMSSLDDVQIIYEPFLTALRLGPDIKDKSSDLLEREKTMRKLTSNIKVDCDDALNSELFSYRYVKENILEAEYPGKKVVFVKDMSYGVSERLHMLPRGYRHAFLIRNPKKVFTSWKKLFSKFTDREVFLKVGENESVPKGYAFGESLQIYEYLTKNGIEPKPFIIDADDLLTNPESILRQFCNFADVKYTDKLLAWGGGSEITKNWKMCKEILQFNEVGNFHKNTFGSQKFGKPSSAPPRSEMTEDVIHCIEGGFPFYKILYELRTIP